MAATNPATALPAPLMMRAGASVRPLLTLLGIAAAVAAGVTVVLWSQGPNWGLLYGSLTQSDASSVVQALQSANIPYKLDAATGGVMVPQERINDARLKLAAQGLPEGDGAGFELIRKDPGFGVSQFMENARYQHALEVEIVRTITSLQAVESARVHLAVPAQSAFVRNRREPSASVFLKLRPGRRLEPEQVSGVVHLVASSIPELEADQVTVVDQSGRLLSAPRNPSDLAAQAQLEAARQLEETFVGRIEALLTPLVGPGRVRAEVTADLDTTAVEETREQYRPESQIVRSEQLAEQMTQGAAGAGGIPGALSNQPPPAGVVQPPATAPATPANAQATPATPAANGEVVAGPAFASASPENTSKQSTRNYEIDRTLSYSKQPAGRVRRLTVAVLVDHQRSVDDEGNPVEKALTAEQLADMTRLVKDAVGFDEQRGDSVNVVNASFLQAPEAEPDEGLPVWQQPMVRDVSRIVLAAVVLIILLLFVVRPLLRGLVPQGGLAAAAGGPRPVDARTVGEPGAAQPAVAGPAASAAIGYEQQMAQARSLASQDPKRVAQVVKTWVSNDE